MVHIPREASAWIADFFRRFRNVRPELADVCLVYLAKQLGMDTIFTLDRRDFTVYRFGKNQNFTLLPSEF